MSFTSRPELEGAKSLEAALIDNLTGTVFATRDEAKRNTWVCWEYTDRPGYRLSIRYRGKLYPYWLDDFRLQDFIFMIWSME